MRVYPFVLLLHVLISAWCVANVAVADGADAELRAFKTNRCLFVVNNLLAQLYGMKVIINNEQRFVLNET